MLLLLHTGNHLERVNMLCGKWLALQKENWRQITDSIFN
jgi:hypothetical protein